MSDLIFDEADITEPTVEPTNFLVVPGAIPNIEKVEAAYRKRGRPLVVFEDEDGSLENAEKFRVAMGLSRMPTLEEAERFTLQGALAAAP